MEQWPDYSERFRDLAKDIGRFLFEHIPTSNFGRSNHLNVVSVAQRTQQIMESSVEVLPPSFHEVDTLQVEPGNE